ncbi:hypothetical protein BRADI_3g11433v3 [Brachypodium distachyon]|uniref:Reverse transcriptase zinc-binding domain-containing protein n=1 Tax=Brachypodium distachyon TaxID=15368 RepID=A0A0Q3F543_BRADI|nr:hypothetical protein BRADI_3g11433v3 [Brachypodium distachyon]
MLGRLRFGTLGSRADVHEDIDRILLGCVVTRHVWTVVLGHWDRLSWVPTVQHTLAGWWTGVEVASRKERKNPNTAIALVCWSIWKHRNAVVFWCHSKRTADS